MQPGHARITTHNNLICRSAVDFTTIVFFTDGRPASASAQVSRMHTLVHGLFFVHQIALTAL
jgi:hypothetical protein